MEIKEKILGALGGGLTAVEVAGKLKITKRSAQYHLMILKLTNKVYIKEWVRRGTINVAKYKKVGLTRDNVNAPKPPPLTSAEKSAIHRKASK
jgi:hypothetical protein